uniref:Uncharacterized protein n=1 Tax=Oryza barthii TaxID=65489 RepID=A0A0D3HDT5_9ORYZ
MVLFYSSCSVFFFSLSCWDLPPPSVVVRQPYFLVASKQALHSAEQEGRVQTVREGEAGWVEEEEEEERRRLGGSKEATAFALLLLGFHLGVATCQCIFLPFQLIGELEPNIALLHNSSAEEVRS